MKKPKTHYAVDVTALDITGMPEPLNISLLLFTLIIDTTAHTVRQISLAKSPAYENQINDTEEAEKEINTHKQAYQATIKEEKWRSCGRKVDALKIVLRWAPIFWGLG